MRNCVFCGKELKEEEKNICTECIKEEKKVGDLPEEILNKILGL